MQEAALLLGGVALCTGRGYLLCIVVCSLALLWGALAQTDVTAGLSILVGVVSLPLSAAIASGVVLRSSFPDVGERVTGLLMLAAALGAFALQVESRDVVPWASDMLSVPPGPERSLQLFALWGSSLMSSVSAAVLSIVIPLILVECVVHALCGPSGESVRWTGAAIMRVVRAPLLVMCVALAIRVLILDSVGQYVEPVATNEQLMDGR